MMLIQVLGVGCPKCAKVCENAQQAVREAGVSARVEKVTDILAITACGVARTPALVIDGAVKFVGQVPSAVEIKILLENHPQGEST